MSTATAAIATLARELEGHLLAHGGRRQGRHVRFACPVHPDEHPSADFDPAKATWICRACGVGIKLIDREAWDLLP